MSDLKNNLEQLWKEEARKAYQDQQSQDNEGGCREPIGFVQGYIASKKESQSKMTELEELQKETDEINKESIQWRDDAIENLNQEIKTLKEQLAEAVRLAKLGINSVNGLLTHNNESWELSAESWLFKTKIFLEKLKKTRMKND